MAYVIYSINTTLNGTCHHEDVLADRVHHDYALTLLLSCDAVLLGRNTFDLFAAFWPEAVHRTDLPSHMTDFARALESKPKYVLTSRPLETRWRNVTVLEGPGLDAVDALLAGEAGRVVVFGSPSAGAALVSAGVVAEVHVLLQPFIGASTTPRLFDAMAHRQTLSLVETRPFDSGAVLLRYEVASRA